MRIRFSDFVSKEEEKLQLLQEEAYNAKLRLEVDELETKLDTLKVEKENRKLKEIKAELEMKYRAAKQNRDAVSSKAGGSHAKPDSRLRPRPEEKIDSYWAIEY